MTATPGAGIPPALLEGDALLADLRRGRVSLPNKTLLALAVGGLRVRMMRSTVTMGSIVLAIAFLTYTGLANELTGALVQAVQTLETYPPLEPASVDDALRRLDGPGVIAALPLADQRRLAVGLGLDNIAGAQSELAITRAQLRELEEAARQEEERVKDLAQAPGASDADRQRAADSLRLAGQRVAQAAQSRDRLSALVALGAWLRAKGSGGTDAGTSGGGGDMPARLAQALAQRAAVLANLANPFRLTAGDLRDVKLILSAIESADLPQPSRGALATIRTAMDHEQSKRSAADLRDLLRGAGVNPQATQADTAAERARAVWLIVMAMLTCAVGIANAMLMSVTERFREIGTMKCLGAQDNLVVKLFLLESGFLGVIGAALGIVVGLAVALMAAVLQFRGFGLREFPIVASLPVVLLSVLGGIVLSIIGAVYPAWAASRMRPVDALRVDE